MAPYVVHLGPRADPPNRPSPDTRSAGLRRRLQSYSWDPSYRTAGRPSLVLETPMEPINAPPSRLYLAMGAPPEPLNAASDDWQPSRHAAEWMVGLPPSTHDVRFATQMVYAVAQWTIQRFRRALGREPDFVFEGPLVLELFSAEMQNVVYERHFKKPTWPGAGESGVIRFGWYRQRRESRGAHQPGAIANTALSFDVIVHEVTHALVDGLRPHFLVPSNPDVLALHEAIADLVTLFAHFAWPAVVADAIKADPERFGEQLVRTLARQLGQTTSDAGEPLRTIRIDWVAQRTETPATSDYDAETDPHRRGLLLVSAVFEAFAEIYQRRADPILALHRKGTALSDALIALLAGEASKLADQFLDIVIRAIDYLPPVDPTFGEYLRALITADRALAPQDRWDYREALIYAFRRHRIPVEGVHDLSEGSLTWRQVRDPLLVPLDAFADVAAALGSGRGSPGDIAMHTLAEHPALCAGLALTPNADGDRAAQSRDAVDITVEQIRSLRRVGADRTSVAGAVMTITARRPWGSTPGVLGGCTLVLDERGHIAQHIWKSAHSADRLIRQQLGTVPGGIR